MSSKEDITRSTRWFKYRPWIGVLIGIAAGIWIGLTMHSALDGVVVGIAEILAVGITARQQRNTQGMKGEDVSGT